MFLAATASTVACHDAFSPSTAIGGAIAIPAPPSYQQWWHDVEKCSAITGDFARVTWYAVPNVTTFPYRGQEDYGYWWATHDIVIAGGSISDSMVVRHEMLHDLLGTGTHPDEYFLYKCWGVVDYRSD